LFAETITLWLKRDADILQSACPLKHDVFINGAQNKLSLKDVVCPAMEIVTPIPDASLVSSKSMYMAFRTSTAVAGSQGVGGPGVGAGATGAGAGVVEFAGVGDDVVEFAGIGDDVVEFAGVGDGAGDGVVVGARVVVPSPPQPCKRAVMGAARAKHKALFDGMLDDATCKK